MFNKAVKSLLSLRDPDDKVVRAILALVIQLPLLKSNGPFLRSISSSAFPGETAEGRTAEVGSLLPQITLPGLDHALTPLIFPY